MRVRMREREKGIEGELGRERKARVRERERVCVREGERTARGVLCILHVPS